jgi:hypothetical protein
MTKKARITKVEPSKPEPKKFIVAFLPQPDRKMPKTPTGDLKLKTSVAKSSFEFSVSSHECPMRMRRCAAIEPTKLFNVGAAQVVSGVALEVRVIYL